MLLALAMAMLTALAQALPTVVLAASYKVGARATPQGARHLLAQCRPRLVTPSSVQLASILAGQAVCASSGLSHAARIARGTDR
jgi:hypothetical protein